ncbi:MAG: bifunctional demethylmenaquinone methyltransferase/2-methoxy-6-polyprenyl-1,4-benzoquinol methylase UbiE [Bacteroidetes bacterium]|jgi:demethylmenaquinone methyltransferase/2-methoxy-6-polyprenyl-1,4-benzoquinol methylase|nr:bifunctional demethylmenaquinone methyltransferase/2-methoxy-6-polyprenyl-1,4-benzoquinol methylase UbiE [Bacteroidota bacterium]
MSHKHDTVTPYGQQAGEKKKQVAQMFDAISRRYDFLNHFLSGGIDILWRRRAVRMLRPLRPRIVIDLATGTGDFAIEAARILKPERVIGVDISSGMLEVGREKMRKRKLTQVEMVLGDSENMPYPDNFCDAITVGFGVRNFENLEKGLAEMYRILRPGGAVVILEPAVPAAFPMRQLVQFYYKTLLPFFGGLFSRDPRAYQYLPNSVQAFPHGPAFLTICQRIGYKNTQFKSLSLGICALYWLEK